MESIALVYAKALFSLSLEENEDKRIFEELSEIYSIIEHDDSLIKLLDNKVISKDEKKKTLGLIFEDKLEKNLFNFLKLLIDKSRFNSLKKICLEYKKLYFEHYNIKEAKVYSATQLSDAKLNDLKTTLEQKYNCDFVMQTFIDKDLVAGLKVVIGDTVIDGTINNRLAKLKQNIILK